MLALCVSWQCLDVSSRANPAPHAMLRPGGSPQSPRGAQRRRPGDPSSPRVPAPRKGNGRARSRKKTTALGRGAGRLVDLIAAPSEESWGWALLARRRPRRPGDPFQPAGAGGPLATGGERLRLRLGSRRGTGVVRRRRRHPARGAGEARPGGILAALVLLLVVSAGLADLAAGSPGTSAAWRLLGGAGGIVGAGVGGGLSRIIGVAGCLRRARRRRRGGDLRAGSACPCSPSYGSSAAVLRLRHDGRPDFFGTGSPPCACSRFRSGP